jgi:hypothetical protein
MKRDKKGSTQGYFWVVFLLLNSPAFAQVEAGRIIGTVYDPNRAVIVGAKVTVVNANTNLGQNATTDGTGEYVVTPVDPAIYTVSVGAVGFQTAVRTVLKSW